MLARTRERERCGLWVVRDDEIVPGPILYLQIIFSDSNARFRVVWTSFIMNVKMFTMYIILPAFKSRVVCKNVYIVYYIACF